MTDDFTWLKCYWVSDEISVCNRTICVATDMY